MSVYKFTDLSLLFSIDFFYYHFFLQTVKQLEKTVLERENRLYQVNTQLEEMKRVQEMVAKLMSKSSNNNS